MSCVCKTCPPMGLSFCKIQLYKITFCIIRNAVYLKCGSRCVVGVCTNATAPSVSSINRILRNRAAERAAAEFARAAGYGLYHPAHAAHPYASFPWPPPGLWPVQGPPSSGGQQALRPPGSPSDMMPRLIGELPPIWPLHQYNLQYVTVTNGKYMRDTGVVSKVTARGADRVRHYLQSFLYAIQMNQFVFPICHWQHFASQISWQCTNGSVYILYTNRILCLCSFLR